MLNRESILSAVDLKREPVPVPEWGGDILLQEMDGLSGAEFWDFVGQQQGNKAGRSGGMLIAARLVVACAIDENGIRLFRDEDVEALAKKSSTAIDRLYDVAARLNGMGKGDAGNSDGEAGDASPSA